MNNIFIELPDEIQNKIYSYLPMHPVAKCFENWFSKGFENYYEQSLSHSFICSENILWLRVKDNHEEIHGYNSYDIDYVISNDIKNSRYINDNNNTNILLTYLKIFNSRL